MDKRQPISAEALESLLREELLRHGCNNEVKVVPAGKKDDWTAGVGGYLTDQCSDAFSIKLGRLKRSYSLTG